MNKVVGTIQKFGSERKTSKAGKPFSVYTVDVDGTTYELKGFKPLNGFSPGDTISFMTEVAYGKNQMDPATVQRASGASSGTAGVSSASTGSASSNAGVRNGGGYAPRPFPIPKLHGDRAIVRQNSLTNAVNLYKSFLEIPGSGASAMSIDNMVDNIIDVAYKFEAYSTGDREAEELEKRKGAKGGKDEDELPF